MASAVLTTSLSTKYPAVLFQYAIASVAVVGRADEELLEAAKERVVVDGAESVVDVVVARVENVLDESVLDAKEEAAVIVALL